MPGLSRFHEAQDPVIDRVLAELRAGAKQSHWMWFIFPQLRSLGRSSTAQFYGIADLAEARAYLADPVLRARLEDCAAAVLRHQGKPAEAIMGPVDAQKLRSSMTLFTEAGGAPVFAGILARFYDAEPCQLTLSALTRS